MAAGRPPTSARILDAERRLLIAVGRRDGPVVDESAVDLASAGASGERDGPWVLDRRSIALAAPADNIEEPDALRRVDASSVYSVAGAALYTPLAGLGRRWVAAHRSSQLGRLQKLTACFHVFLTR
jgi:hypothetical protein